MPNASFDEPTDLRGQLKKLDQRSLLFLSSLVDQFNLIPAARFISRLGDGYLYVVTVVVVYFADTHHGADLLFKALMAFSIELPLYFIFKNGLRRPRPERGLPGFVSRHQASDEFSLPSGHTAAAFLFATLLSFYYPGHILSFYIIACLIGLSRVLLGVHYPSDIAAGIILGIGSALSVIHLPLPQYY